MLIVPLVQLLVGIVALAAVAAASFFVMRRDPRAPLWMVIAGSFGFVFYLTFDPLPYEIIAPILLLVAGVALMVPRVDVAGALDDIEIGESTATRRRR